MKSNSRNRKKRGAIELSMTTIIVIVIGVTLLALGLVWVKNIVQKVNELTKEAFDNAERDVKQNMGSDQKFYISGVEFEMDPGKKQQINVGIRNTLGQDKTFEIRVTSAGGNSDPRWFVVPEKDLIKAGEAKGFPTVLKMPKSAVSGDVYFFRIAAVYDNNVDYESETIVVTVK